MDSVDEPGFVLLVALLRPHTYTPISMSLLSLASHELRRAADLDEKIDKLKEELSGILNSSAPTDATKKKRRKMSDAGRLAIAAAQKARWVKQRIKSTVKPVANKAAKRTISAAARAKMAAATRARWAIAKARGKNAL